MRLLRLSAYERSRSPVFIVGEARSGTTILYRTLQKHSAFRPRKENLWESKVMRYVDDVDSLRPGEPASMLGYMASDAAAYDAFLASIAPLRPLVRLSGRAVQRVQASRWKNLIWASGGHPLVVRSYFHHAREARGVTRVLEKTPGHIRYVDRLLRCYPRARLIYIHRHPVDVYTSYRRRAAVDPNAGPWARIGVRAFAEQWSANSAAALSAAARLGESFLMVPYEDFTARPAEVAERICDFVGEPFDPEIVVEHAPDPTRRPAAPHLYGDITPTTKDWREFLDAKATDNLQRRVAEMMRRLDYHPYTY